LRFIDFIRFHETAFPVNYASIALSVVALLVAIFGLVKSPSGASEDLKASPTDAPASHTGSGPIAYVEFDTLLHYYDYYEELQERFDEKQKKAEKQLVAKRQNLAQTVQNLEKRFQAGLMSQNEAQSAQAQVQAKQQELMELEQNILEGLRAEEKSINDSLFQKIKVYVEKYNENGQYGIVLGFQGGGGVLYADDALNITQEVLERLNADYRAEQKGEAKLEEGEK